MELVLILSAAAIVLSLATMTIHARSKRRTYYREDLDIPPPKPAAKIKLPGNWRLHQRMMAKHARRRREKVQRKRLRAERRKLRNRGVAC